MAEGEFSGYNPEQIKNTELREIRYKGFHYDIREVTPLKQTDIEAVTKIENALTGEYRKKTKKAKNDEMKKWLEKELKLRFYNILPEPKRDSLVGTIAGRHKHGAGDTLSTSVQFDKSENISGYTLLIESEEWKEYSKKEKQKYDADTKIDFSYVTAVPDEKRDVEEMAESFLQTAMMLVEQKLGRKVYQLTGELTEEEILDAEKSLSIFANAGAGKNEKNYRKALEKAGFKEVQTTTEDGEELISHHLSIRELARIFKEKQDPPNFTPL